MPAPPAADPGSACSSFTQHLLLISSKRRHQITDDPARARLNLNSDGHAWRQVDELFVYLHLRAVERDPRRVVHLLALGLAAGGLGAGRFVAGFVLGLIPGDGVLGDIDDLTMQEPVTRKTEGVDSK